VDLHQIHESEEEPKSDQPQWRCQFRTETRCFDPFHCGLIRTIHFYSTGIIRCSGVSDRFFDFIRVSDLRGLCSDAEAFTAGMLLPGIVYQTVRMLETHTRLLRSVKDRIGVPSQNSGVGDRNARLVFELSTFRLERSVSGDSMKTIILLLQPIRSM
jgi:hypothetical protein